jgi:recombination protein RecT
MTDTLRPVNTSRAPKTVAEMLSTDPRLMTAMANALPRHITPDRFARVMLTAIRKNPKLATCKPESLLAAMMTCAQLGLEPNDPRALAYLIPYGSECQLIIGWRGYIELAMRSGMVTSIQAQVVYERDQFEYEQGLELKLRHIPYLGMEDRGKLIAAYAIAVMSNGSKAVVVLSKRDIDRARASSSGVKSGRATPWDDWYDAMAMKTAVRKLAKFMPQSPEFARALEADDAKSMKIDPSTFSVDSIDIEAGSFDSSEESSATPAALAAVSDLEQKLAAKAAAVKQQEIAE